MESSLRSSLKNLFLSEAVSNPSFYATLSNEPALKTKSFIKKVLEFPLEDIAKPLSNFHWEFGNVGNIHHWTPLFLHFDTYFKTYISCRNELLLPDYPFLKKAVLEILRVMEIILEKCHNKSSFSGIEHFKFLLASADPDVLIAALETLSSLVKITPSKSSGKMVGCGSLNSSLLSLAKGWGSKKEGWGLHGRTQEDGLCPFRFEVQKGGTKLQLYRICILAFIVLVQSDDSHDELVSFIANEPGYTNELIWIVRSKNISVSIRALAATALGAQLAAHSASQERAGILSGLSNNFTGNNCMLLINVLQGAISSLKYSSKCDLALVEALLQFFLLDLVSSLSIGSVVRGSGMVPTFLPLLQDSDSTHLHLVCLAVNILQKLMDYSNAAVAIFKDMGGIELLVKRLQIEVGGVTDFIGKDDISIAISECSGYKNDELNPQKTFIMALLEALCSRSQNLSGTSLTPILSAIFTNKEQFGGEIYSAAVALMSDMIHNNPTCLDVFNELGLPTTFLSSVVAGTLTFPKAIKCIPEGLIAICLNDEVKRSVIDTKALRFLFDIFTDRKYVMALNGVITSLASSMEVLLSNVYLLREIGIDLIIEIIRKISSLGDTKCSGSDGIFAGSNVMEIDAVESMDKETLGGCSLIGDGGWSYENISDEQFMYFFISHVLQLVQNTLANPTLCMLFALKDGIKFLLKLLIRPIITQSREGMSVALREATVFKYFANEFSSKLVDAFCSSLHDYLEQTFTECSVGSGSFQQEPWTSPDSRVFSCHMLVGLHLFLAPSEDRKWLTALLNQFGNDRKDVLEGIGLIHRTVLWQIAQLEDMKVEGEDNFTGTVHDGSRQPKIMNFTKGPRFDSHESGSFDASKSSASKDDDNNRSYCCDMVRFLSNHITHLFRQLGKEMLLPSRMGEMGDSISTVSSTLGSIAMDHMSIRDSAKHQASVSTIWCYFSEVFEFVADILLNRHRLCNPAILIGLYKQKVIKKILETTEGEEFWVCGPKASYGKLMEHLLTLSYEPSQITNWLIQNETFSEEDMIADLEFMVMEAVRKVWEDTQFPQCSQDFIIRVVNIVKHILSSVELHSSIDVSLPQVKDLLLVCQKILQTKETLVFPVSDLLLMLCYKNEGQRREGVILFIIDEVKQCSNNVFDSENQNTLSAFLHVLDLILKKDEAAREIAFKNGLVRLVSDLLGLWSSGSHHEETPQVPKWVASAFVAIDRLAQVDKTLDDVDDAGEQPSAKYLPIQEQEKLIEIACACIRKQVPSETMHAVLQLCATLTRTHSVAVSFLDAQGLNSLLLLPISSLFVGFDCFVAVIICHILEDSPTLQQAMESEIRHTVATAANQQPSEGLNIENFISSLSTVFQRDPFIFMKAAKSVCQVEEGAVEKFIVLTKDRDEKEKLQTIFWKGSVANTVSDQTFGLVTSLLQKHMISFTPPSEDESTTKICSSSTDIELDISKSKGKEKAIASISEENESNSQESSLSVAKVILLLKLLTEIILFHSSFAHVLVQTEAELYSGRFFQHALHKFLMYSDNHRKERKTEGDWRHELSNRANKFLVASCVCSTEARKRIFTDINNVFNDKNSMTPQRVDIRALIDLLKDVLAACSPTGSYISAEASVTFIEVGLVHSLTRTLHVLDLDHADSPKVITEILKILELVTMEHVHAFESNNGRRERLIKPTDRSQFKEDNGGIMDQGIYNTTNANENLMEANQLASFRTIHNSGGSGTVIYDMEHLDDEYNDTEEDEDEDADEDDDMSIDVADEVDEDELLPSMPYDFSRISENYGDAHSSRSSEGSLSPLVSYFRSLQDGREGNRFNLWENEVQLCDGDPNSRVRRSFNKWLLLSSLPKSAENDSVEGRSNILPQSVEAPFDYNVGNYMSIGGRDASLCSVTKVSEDPTRQAHEDHPSALVKSEGLKALIRLLFVVQPLYKSEQRLLLNLCAHAETRIDLIKIMMNLIMLNKKKSSSSLNVTEDPYRLYAYPSHEMYPHPQCDDEVPPLVSLRVLETLTYIARNHPMVAELLLVFRLPEFSLEESLQDAGGHESFMLLLSLLNQSLYSRSIAHLEQLLNLLDVIIDHAKRKSNSSDGPEASASVATLGQGDVSMKASSSGTHTVNAQRIMNDLPKQKLQFLSSLLAHEGLSENGYTLVAKLLTKLAVISPGHRHIFISELGGSVKCLTKEDVENDMVCTATTHGASVLRVLQILSSLVVLDKEVTDAISLMREINESLDPLCPVLRNCISKIKKCSGTQDLLPYIEAFFVACEKLHLGWSSAGHYGKSVVSDVDKATSSGTQQKTSVLDMKHGPLINFSEEHKVLLNTFIRENPGLLEKSFSFMLKVPHLIDFDNKLAHFRSKIKHQHEHHDSPLKISVRRDHILEDSYNQLRMKSAQDFKRSLVVHFRGESGVDVGGVTREWFQLLSRRILDEDVLLFTTLGNEPVFQPNPNSVCKPNHLSYFKFFGKVVGKALYDGQLLNVHFTLSFYKHILGLKVIYQDFEATDPDRFKNLKWMLENDVKDLDLSFAEELKNPSGDVKVYEFFDGGQNVSVTEENKRKYVDLYTEHWLTTSIRPQIDAFIEGLSELILRDLISIFSADELELLISGQNDIDLDDLMVNTKYYDYSASSLIIQWFWEVVKDFSKEEKVRLLQFVTGTSKVPLEGFRALGSQFQIYRLYGSKDNLPTAQTCSNQLNLPEYRNKQQLKKKLLCAINEAREGFGLK